MSYCPFGGMLSKSLVSVSIRLVTGGITRTFDHDSIARSLMMGNSENTFRVAIDSVIPCVVCNSQLSWSRARYPRLPSSTSECVRLEASSYAIEGSIRKTYAKE